MHLKGLQPPDDSQAKGAQKVCIFQSKNQRFLAKQKHLANNVISLEYVPNLYPNIKQEHVGIRLEHLPKVYESLSVKAHANSLQTHLALKKIIERDIECDKAILHEFMTTCKILLRSLNKIEARSEKDRDMATSIAHKYDEIKAKMEKTYAEQMHYRMAFQNERKSLTQARYFQSKIHKEIDLYRNEFDRRLKEMEKERSAMSYELQTLHTKHNRAEKELTCLREFKKQITRFSADCGSPKLDIMLREIEEKLSSIDYCDAILTAEPPPTAVEQAFPMEVRTPRGSVNSMEMDDLTYLSTIPDTFDPLTEWNKNNNKAKTITENNNNKVFTPVVPKTEVEEPEIMSGSDDDVKEVSNNEPSVCSDLDEQNSTTGRRTCTDSDDDSVFCLDTTKKEIVIKKETDYDVKDFYKLERDDSSDEELKRKKELKQKSENELIGDGNLNKVSNGSLYEDVESINKPEEIEIIKNETQGSIPSQNSDNNMTSEHTNWVNLAEPNSTTRTIELELPPLSFSSLLPEDDDMTGITHGVTVKGETKENKPSIFDFEFEVPANTVLNFDTDDKQQDNGAWSSTFVNDNYEAVVKTEADQTTANAEAETQRIFSFDLSETSATSVPKETTRVEVTASMPIVTEIDLVPATSKVGPVPTPSVTIEEPTPVHVITQKEPAPAVTQQKHAPAVTQQKHAPAPAVTEKEPAPAVTEKEPAPAVTQKEPAPAHKVAQEERAPAVTRKEPAPAPVPAVTQKKPAPAVTRKKPAPAPAVTKKNPVPAVELSVAPTTKNTTSTVRSEKIQEAKAAVVETFDNSPPPPSIERFTNSRRGSDDSTSSDGKSVTPPRLKRFEEPNLSESSESESSAEYEDEKIPQREVKSLQFRTGKTVKPMKLTEKDLKRAVVRSPKKVVEEKEEKTPDDLYTFAFGLRGRKNRGEKDHQALFDKLSKTQSQSKGKKNQGHVKDSASTTKGKGINPSLKVPTKTKTPSTSEPPTTQSVRSRLVRECDVITPVSQGAKCQKKLIDEKIMKLKEQGGIKSLKQISPTTSPPAELTPVTNGTKRTSTEADLTTELPASKKTAAADTLATNSSAFMTPPPSSKEPELPKSPTISEPKSTKVADNVLYNLGSDSPYQGKKRIAHQPKIPVPNPKQKQPVVKPLEKEQVKTTTNATKTNTNANSTTNGAASNASIFSASKNNNTENTVVPDNIEIKKEKTSSPTSFSDIFKPVVDTSVKTEDIDIDDDGITPSKRLKLEKRNSELFGDDDHGIGYDDDDNKSSIPKTGVVVSRGKDLSSMMMDEFSSDNDDDNDSESGSDSGGSGSSDSGSESGSEYEDEKDSPSSPVPEEKTDIPGNTIEEFSEFDSTEFVFKAREFFCLFDSLDLEDLVKGTNPREIARMLCEPPPPVILAKAAYDSVILDTSEVGKISNDGTAQPVNLLPEISRRLVYILRNLISSNKEMYGKLPQLLMEYFVQLIIPDLRVTFNLANTLKRLGQFFGVLCSKQLQLLSNDDGMNIIMELLYWRTPHAFPFAYGYVCCNSDAFVFYKFDDFPLRERVILYCLEQPVRYKDAKLVTELRSILKLGRKIDTSAYTFDTFVAKVIEDMKGLELDGKIREAVKALSTLCLQQPCVWFEGFINTNLTKWVNEWKKDELTSVIFGALIEVIGYVGRDSREFGKLTKLKMMVVSLNKVELFRTGVLAQSLKATIDRLDAKMERMRTSCSLPLHYELAPEAPPKHKKKKKKRSKGHNKSFGSTESAASSSSKGHHRFHQQGKKDSHSPRQKYKGEKNDGGKHKKPKKNNSPNKNSNEKSSGKVPDKEKFYALAQQLGQL